MEQQLVVPAQAGEQLAADADVVSLLWTANLREKAALTAQSMFDAESLRADAGRADNDTFSSVCALFAAQSPEFGVVEEKDGRPVLVSAEGPALTYDIRVRMVAWGWYSSVRVMVLDAYKTKRPGLTDNAYDQAWKRVTDLVDHVIKGGFKAPTSDNPDAIRKAAERAAAKVKREAAQQELLAAFEGKSESDLQAELKSAYGRAAKGDEKGAADAERIKEVRKLRADMLEAEQKDAVADRWKRIIAYSKRKVDGEDNKLFVSDIRVLDAVLDVLQSQ